ncbi:MAG: ABC transporter permease [Phycisphaerae bacterium]
MYKWFFAWRYLHTKIIAIFAISGVAVCVFMVLVAMSVMGGFLDTVRERSRGMLSDVIVDNGWMQGFPYYDAFSKTLMEQHGDIVELVTPQIISYGIFRVPSTGDTRPAQVCGIKLDEYVRVGTFAEGLHYARYYPGTTNLGPQQQPIAGYGEDGRIHLPDVFEAANRRWADGAADADAVAEYREHPFSQFPMPGTRVFEAWAGPPMLTGDPYPGAIIGCDMINQRTSTGTFERFYPRGMLVSLAVLPLSEAGTPTGEPPVNLALRYADDSRTGVYEIDSMAVYVDFDTLQQKLAMDPQPLDEGAFTPARTRQLLIKLRDGVDLNAARDRLEAAWRTFSAPLIERGRPREARLLDAVRVSTWEDLQRKFIMAVEKEKILMMIILAVISVVAVVLIGCIFYMIVEKKTRDIGILKALGASGRGVAALFVVYAGAVGVVGSIIGAAAGTVFVWYINDIQDTLSRLHPQLRMWNPEVYSFDRIPNVVKPGDVVGIAVVAVAASVVGSVIPAILAGRVWPVRALRYE